MTEILKGSVDQSVEVRFVDSTDGTPETGVVAATGGLAFWYRRELGAKVAIGSLSDLATLATAHADGGLLHISDGYYRIDVPDAAFATGANYVVIGASATGMVGTAFRVSLVDYILDGNVSSNVTVTPVISLVLPAGELISQPIEICQYETKAYTFTLLDENQDPVNDSGDAFKLVVYKLDKVTVLFQTTGTAGGVSGNQVPVIIADTNTAVAGTYYYRLWNTTEDTVRAENSFEIKKGAAFTP